MVIRQTQLFQSYGDEPALQSERGGRGYFEDGSKNHAPLLQELPNETSSLRAQEHFSDRDWGDYSEENLLRLEKDGSTFHSQMQTQNNLMGLAPSVKNS